MTEILPPDWKWCGARGGLKDQKLFSPFAEGYSIHPAVRPRVVNAAWRRGWPVLFRFSDLHLRDGSRKLDS